MSAGWAVEDRSRQSRLVELRGDKDWTHRYFAGDKSAIAEYDRLIAAVASRGLATMLGEDVLASGAIDKCDL